MAAALGHGSSPVDAGRRLIVWGILSALVGVLVFAFLQKSRDVQEQAEVAAVRTTLAALRTSLTIEHIRARTATGNSVANSRQNPFTVLQQLPGNYRGELDLVQALAGPPGWYFDSGCRCVGYLPAQFGPPSENLAARVMLFQVVPSDGPTQLVAVERYSLHGQPVD